MKNAPKRALAVMAVAAVAALSACGSSTHASSTSMSARASASSDASAAPTAPGTRLTADQILAVLRPSMGHMTSLHMVMTMKLPLGGRGVVMNAHGDMAMVNGAMTMDMYATSPTMAQVGEMEMRLTRDAFYMKMALPQLGGKWIKVDLKDTSNPLAGMLGSVASMAPSQTLSKLSGGIVGATYVGADSHGQHYQMTVDTAKQIANLPDAFKSDPRTLEQLKSLPPTQTVNYWLRDGRVVRMQSVIGSTGGMTMDLSNYGEKVSVIAPPLSDTTPFSMLAASGQASA